ncbi:uncharacterized protein [Watersipora subatra]|uniref:uncharacterized protein n=1 Tax=Watersipora subatra TaxID=2589382 RepID=UPI00355C3CFB
MLALEDSFFFDQAPFREPIKRYKKRPDELPHSLRYAHLNPKLASFYKDKEGEEGETLELEEDAGKESILPEISNTFVNIRNQLLTGFMPSFDSTRLTIQENKAVTPTLLEEIAKLLPLVKQSNKKLSFPRSLQQNLQSTFDDLVYDAKYTKRQWQVLENQMKYDAEQREKAEKEAGELKAEEAKKARLEGSDSDDELNKVESADQGRGSKLRRRRHRHTQSQPAVIIEEEPSNATQKKPQRLGSALRKPATAPGKQDGSRLAVGRGEDIPSETSHSLRSSHPVSYGQPYSMTVLTFNLSNYQSWENKGCHVFGIDRQDNDDHPLEWVVKRLSRTSSQIKVEQEEAVRLRRRELPFTRYYMDNVTEKSLAKSAGDRLGIFNTVMKGGKPKIPSLKTKPYKGQILCTQINDGSRTIYYEGGELAIVTSRGADSGFYTIAYDKDKRMLASFTPLGTGCCYTSDNTPLLLVTSSGGFYTNQEDDVEEWTWPSGTQTKLSYPINVTLSKHISIKIVGRSSITLVFQFGNQFIKTPVGLTEGLENTQPPSIDDLSPLQMSDRIAYTCQAAQSLLQKPGAAPSQTERQPTGSVLKKTRSVKTPKKEETSNVEFSEAHVIQYDISKFERDYSKLKNKAK